MGMIQGWKMNTEAENIHHKRGKRRIIAQCMRFLPALIAFGVRFLHRSCNVTLIGAENVEQIAAAEKGGVVAFWHCCFPGVAYFFRDCNFFTVISESRDGDLAAGMVESLGYRPFRGSPGKGGARAVAKFIAAFRKSPMGGFVTDGSQGPARIAQKGPVAVALHSGAPICPVGMAAYPCWRLPSWDRTIIAKPFSRVVVAMGTPIWIERGSTAQMIEERRVELEKALNALCELAEDVVQGRVAQNTQYAKIKSFRNFFLRMKNRYPKQGR